jgi:endonuclease YncB( thermonuclease family)
MDSFIAEQGGRVTCELLNGGAYRCRTGQGYDVAAAALVNGAARVAPDAPEDYREMQTQAQSNHRGIWR